MTKATAAKYNALLAKANSKVCLVKEGDWKSGYDPDWKNGYRLMGGDCRQADVNAILAFIEACRVRVEAQAVAEEIARAAAAHRRADVYTGDQDHSLAFWGQVNGHCDGAGGIALGLVIADIEREIERLNDLRVAEWEAYRVACEQRVAVPPAEDATK